MTRVLVVTDAAWARNDVHAALTSPDFALIDHADPATAASVASADDIQAVVVDLQVSAMGGMAVARSVRENTTVAGGEPTPVILLLDRAADQFLAGRSGAAGWVVKPFTAQELRSAVARALEGATAESDVPDDAEESPERAVDDASSVDDPSVDDPAEDVPDATNASETPE